MILRAAGDQARLQGQIGTFSTLASAFGNASGISPNLYQRLLNMAPTFRPYQSVGQGLNRLNLPEGAEAREAQRTMTVLSQAMDRMSNFYFNKAEELAAIEGEKFGIENMSLQKLKDANKRNEDIFDVPEFGNTVFGKAARASALTVLKTKYSRL